MNEGIEKFRKLLLTDEDFRSKLKDAMEAYTGEKTEEAVFQNVVIPFAASYGITATYDEFKDYLEHLNSEDTEMDKDEIAQVAGGKHYGLGTELCYYIGMGVGGTSDGVCIGIGGSDGAQWEVCMVQGGDVTDTTPDKPSCYYHG